MPLRFAVLELTNRCNLRCPHCASNSGPPRKNELSTDEWLAVIDDMAALGGEEITLIGGEVFLHRDWLRIARHVTDVGMDLAIVTNGLLVDDKVFEQLLTVPLARLGVSLDGATPDMYRQVRGVDGFQRVWDLLMRFRDHGHAPVSAITTVSRVNIGHVERLAELIRPTGIDWQVQFASSVSERFDDSLFITPAEFLALCRQLGEMMLSAGDDNFIAPMDDFGYFPLDPVHAPLHAEWSGCHAGLQVIGVRANGDLLGCLSLGDPFIETNLRQRPLIEAWPAADTFRQFRDKACRLTGACSRCPMAERCQAGCTAMAWSATGSITENPYCMRQLETAELLEQIAL
jgi:radical SAM protein with 4Fe4S-binding SPASM domain